MSLAWGGSVSWESVCSILKAKQELSWQRGQCAQRPGTGWVPGELRAAVWDGEKGTFVFSHLLCLQRCDSLGVCVPLG